MKNLGIVPEGTAYCGRKQNAHVERVIGTLKADCFLPEECETFEEANVLVARAITEYKRGISLFQSGFYESYYEFRRAYEGGRVYMNHQSYMEITLKDA